MRYLGKLQGVGVLTHREESVARAEYELDGYLMKPGHIAGAGEIRATPEILNLVFGSRDLTLRTEGGRVLSVRFSDKRLRPQDAVASIEVTGDLPSASDWGR